MLRCPDQTVQCNRTGSGFSVSLTVEPEDSETTVLGKSVSDLQDNILIGQNSISGTLKYVTGYTGFSGNPSQQDGHFIALKFESDADEVTVEIVGGTSGPVALDEDMNWVGKITNDSQKIRVIATKDGATITKLYDLSQLEFEPEGE